MSISQFLEKVGYLQSDDDRSVVALNQFFGVNIGVAANIPTKLQGNPAVVKPSAGGSFFGILQNNPMQGEACELIRKGTSQAYAGGSFSVGDSLKLDANGAFIKGASGDAIVAIAVEQAVLGDITTVYITG